MIAWQIKSSLKKLKKIRPKLTLTTYLKLLKKIFKNFKKKFMKKKSSAKLNELQNNQATKLSKKNSIKFLQEKNFKDKNLPYLLL